MHIHESQLQASETSRHPGTSRYEVKITQGGDDDGIIWLHDEINDRGELPFVAHQCFLSVRAVHQAHCSAHVVIAGSTSKSQSKAHVLVVPQGKLDLLAVGWSRPIYTAEDEKGHCVQRPLLITREVCHAVSPNSLRDLLRRTSTLCRHFLQHRNVLSRTLVRLHRIGCLIRVEQAGARGGRRPLVYRLGAGAARSGALHAKRHISRHLRNPGRVEHR
mmetsp:Transcript_105934/g.252749  ORF Transcript_105934/g.252749 Transcript_105934/m.252749 type:complete len:218 (+) Transcript_105934:208-861(+)